MTDTHQAQCYQVICYQVPCIYPLRQIPDEPLVIQVPGSKSITNRALLLATLANGDSVLEGVLFSDDSRAFLHCIQELGFFTKVNEEAKTIRVTGLGGRIPKKEASQYVGSAGTAARFLTACLGTAEGVYHMDASAQMRRRPMAPLLNCLKDLGCEVAFEEKDGFFPFTLISHGFGKDSIQVNIQDSSQFLSALLIAGVRSARPFQIQVEGTHGMSYIDMTVKMMEQFGVRVDRTVGKSVSEPATSGQLTSGKLASLPCFTIPSGQTYRGLHYLIEADASAACYFYALSPLLGIRVLVPGIFFDSLQGDTAFLSILEKMGCRAENTSQGILMHPPVDGIYHGIDVNMHACSDQAITLAALAVFADSPTTIRGIGHIRHQESDRIAAIVTELGKMGILCRESEESITIYPGKPKPCSIDTYDDHRMAMGFSLIGLRAEGMIIQNPSCCSKTFENYFTVLEQAIEFCKL